MRRIGSIAALLCTTAVFGQSVVPDGFTDSLVAAISAPTAIAFVPDGRMLVTSQSGTLRVVDTTATVLPAALTIPSNRICTNSERGLLGVAADPEFAENSFIYLYYTHRADGVTCGSRTLPMPMNRVSRFVLRDNNTVDFGSETVLIANLPSWNGNHNGGDLQFGPDGHLYVSVGDSGCDPYGNGCAGTNDAARDVHTLLGKILRIRKDGSIPADNPWTGEGTARCHEQNAPAGVRCQETWAWGLRNPFRIAFGAAGNRTLFAMDVGQNVWEEINAIEPGGDYGWNQREGGCANGSLTNCPAPAPTLRDPVYAYAHGRTVPGTQSSGCNSISGGAFIPPGFGPVEFQGEFLFADYVCGSIFRLIPDGGGSRAVDFARLPSGTIHLTFGPGGLYYSTYANGGQVRRIADTADRPNRPPVAVLSQVGTAYVGSLAMFSAEGSIDPDGDRLTEFLWDFGDGAGSLNTNFGSAGRTYAEPGRYTVTLRVRDARGAISEPARKDIQVLPASPGTPTIVFPDTNSRFRANDVVELRANSEGEWFVTLSEDGVPRRYASGSGQVFPMRTPGPASLDLMDKTVLTVNFGPAGPFGGVVFRPQLAPVTLQTDPPGLDLHVNGKKFTTPATFQSWPGYPLYVSAPDQHGYSASLPSQKIVTGADAVTIAVGFTGTRESSRLEVLDAAGYQAQNLAPGSMGTVRATGGLVFTGGDVLRTGDGSWPEMLGGLQVSFADRFLPIYVADAGSITFQVPAGLEPNKRDLLRVWRDGEILDQVWTTLDATSPGIFADSQTAAYIEGKQAFVKVLGTGFRNAAGPVEVLVNGTPAEGVTVLAHTFPGVDELTVGIPANVYHPGGTVTLIATAGFKASNVAKVRLPE